MFYIDKNISIEEFFKLYPREKIIQYIEDLYYLHDCLNIKIEK